MKRVPPKRTVEWLAHRMDDGDNMPLDGIESARNVAAAGWVIVDRGESIPIAYISRDVLIDGDFAQVDNARQEFNPGDVIRVR